MGNKKIKITGFNADLIDNENKGKSFLSKIGRVPLTIAATVTLLCSMGFYVKYSTSLDENRQKITYLSELSQLSERVEKSALLVRSADANAFNDLDKSKNRIEDILKVLKDGGSLDALDAKVSPISGSSAQTLNKVLTQWEQNKALIDTLLKQKDILPELKEQILKANENSEEFKDSVIALQSSLQKYSTGVNPLLVQEVAILSERILAGSQAIFGGGGFSLEKGYSFVKDLRVFNQIMNNLKNGSYVFNSPKISNDSVPALNQVEKTFAPYAGLTDSIVKQVTTLNDAKEVAEIMTISAREISQTASGLTKDLNEQVSTINLSRIISLLSLALTFILVVLLVIKEAQRARELADLAKVLEKNQNNEAAVDVLIEQMKPLSEGDLSHKIEVEDKFLQQVATGMDSARHNLSSVVVQMKQSALKVLSVARSNTETSEKLNNDAQAQIQKLGEALESVGTITNDLDDVAQSTWSAKEDSIKSKEASEQGGQLVKATIVRMDGIRNNIQESSKKIKKLGESAQTITNIIDLIRDITKKINILSLNAAIQAASSKSSTREFTVLAQEVQELAKDSEEATTKIEELVKDIQVDTAEAIASMERTTQEVVEGAKLTQEAGEALKQIGELSIQVAAQVEEAANKLEEKSGEMALVSFSMGELRKISEQTVSSSLSSKEQVNSLQEVATDINNAIGNFKV